MTVVVLTVGVGDADGVVGAGADDVGVVVAGPPEKRGWWNSVHESR